VTAESAVLHHPDRNRHKILRPLNVAADIFQKQPSQRWCVRRFYWRRVQ